MSVLSLVTARREAERSMVMRVTQEDEDRVKRIWDAAMARDFGKGGHYISVAVLIVHWAEALDQDLNARSEVTKSSITSKR